MYVYKSNITVPPRPWLVYGKARTRNTHRYTSRRVRTLYARIDVRRYALSGEAPKLVDEFKRH